MPKISVWTDPNKVAALSEELKQDLSDYLMEQISKSFSFPADWVEVVFVNVEKAVNAAPLNIEVMYSVSEHINPNKKTVEEFSGTVTGHIIQMLGLPDEIDEVTCWVLPQYSAVYKSAKRLITNT